jgi:hypothetical protein
MHLLSEAIRTMDAGDDARVVRSETENVFDRAQAGRPFTQSSGNRTARCG